MNIRTGTILAKAKARSNYVFVDNISGKLITIPFSNSFDLIKGDIVEILIDDNNGFSVFLEKIGNAYFDTLKKYIGTDQTIEAKIVEQNEGGFVVEYEGFRCFLPNSLSLVGKNNLSVEDVLNHSFMFHVLDITDKDVILTRKIINNQQRLAVIQEEIEKLEKEHNNIANVKRIESFGLIMSMGRIESLLHISDFFYFLHSKKSLKLISNQFKTLVEFSLGSNFDLQVEVKEIKEYKIYLTCDMSNEYNSKLMEKILKMAALNEACSSLIHYYYPKYEEILAVKRGDLFFGFVESISRKKLYIRINNLLGEVSIGSIIPKDKIEGNPKTYLKENFKMFQYLQIAILDFELDLESNKPKKIKLKIVK